MFKLSGIKALKILKKNKQKAAPARNGGTVLMTSRVKAVSKQPKIMVSTDVPTDSATKRHASIMPEPSARKRRYDRRSHPLKRVFASLRSITGFLPGKKDKTSAALAFAMNRSKSKREKRRQYLIYGGAGVLLVVVLLAILIPGGQAAPANADTTQRQTALVANADMMQGDVRPAGAKMPVLLTFTAAFADDDDPFDTFSDSDMDIDSGDQTDDDPDGDDDTVPDPEPTPKPTPKPIDIDKLIDYFVVEEGPYYDSKKYSTNHYKYTEEEYLALARIIHGESRGESFKGQVAVGNVVMNRVLCRGAWPNDIIGVISAPKQFSPYNKYKDLPASQISSSAKRAARAILDKQLWVIPQDVYFFKSSSAQEGVDWGSHPYYGKIGAHAFYRHAYSGRQRGGDVPPALFERVYKYAQYGCKSSNRVYRIQYMLNKLGYDVKADKYFGQTTKDALIEFQKKHKLKADGVAGPATLKKLISEFGAQRYVDKFVK